MTESKEIEGEKWFKLEQFQATLDIDGKKFIRVHDWTSKQTLHELNYHYLSSCPMSELLWFLDNVVALLKEKAVKFELPAEAEQ